MKDFIMSEQWCLNCEQFSTGVCKGFATSDEPSCVRELREEFARPATNQLVFDANHDATTHSMHVAYMGMNA